MLNITVVNDGEVCDCNIDVTCDCMPGFLCLINGAKGGGSMTDTNVFALAQLVKSGKGDPSAVTDAIWDAGYRQPERTAEEAAQITIDTFFYCNMFGMPTECWPRSYDSVLLNELNKAVVGEDFELDGADPLAIAKSVIKAGFKLSAESQNTEVVHGENG